MFLAQPKVESKPDSAFSLMELIVVMAVVAVLLVIVLSAHAKPRNRVYQLTDASNHRRLLQAATSYAADHNDSLPYSGWTNNTNWAWATPIPPGGGGAISTYETVYPQQLAMVTNGQLFPYLLDSRVFMCPADKHSNPSFLYRVVYVTSYTWNGAVTGGATSPVGYKLSQFRPDAILQWENDERFPFLFNDPINFPDEGISQRHGTNAMFGMFGGGVGSVSVATWFSSAMAGNQRGFGQFPNVVANPTPNRLWCNPGRPSGLFF